MNTKTKHILLAGLFLTLGVILANLVLLFTYFFNENTAVKIYLALSLVGYGTLVWLVLGYKKIIFPKWFKIAYIPLTFIIFFVIGSQPWERNLVCPQQSEQIEGQNKRVEIMVLGQSYSIWQKNFWTGEVDIERCKAEFKELLKQTENNPPPPEPAQ